MERRAESDHNVDPYLRRWCATMREFVFRQECCCPSNTPLTAAHGGRVTAVGFFVSIVPINTGGARHAQHSCS
jgi:hypothetical protein